MHLNNSRSSRAEFESVIANGITTPYGTILRGIALQLLNDQSVQAVYPHLYSHAYFLRLDEEAMRMQAQEQV